MNTRLVSMGSILALVAAAPVMATTQYQISDVRLLRDAVNSEATTLAETNAALNSVPVGFSFRETEAETATIGVVDAEPLAWNQAGVVVGSALTVSGQQIAFVWDEEDGMANLNIFVPSGTRLVEGISIDDSGRIIAKGTSNGEEAEFELSPGSAKAPSATRGVCGSFSGGDAAGGAVGMILLSALAFTQRRRLA